MGFWNRLFSGLRGRTGQSTDTGQTAPSESQRQSGGFLGAVFGVGSTPQIESGNDDVISDAEAQQATDDLQRFSPEDRSQALFYLGWLDNNITPDVRGSARRRWEQEFGTWERGRKRMTKDQWALWRETRQARGDTP